MKKKLTKNTTPEVDLNADLALALTKVREKLADIKSSYKLEHTMKSDWEKRVERAKYVSLQVTPDLAEMTATLLQQAQERLEYHDSAAKVLQEQKTVLAQKLTELERGRQKLEQSVNLKILQENIHVVSMDRLASTAKQELMPAKDETFDTRELQKMIHSVNALAEIRVAG